MSKEFSVIPLSLKEANEFVEKYHRHNKRTVQHKFSLGCIYKEDMIGVVIVGNPVSRYLYGRTTAEILRLCVKEPSPKNACSFLYNKCWNIWKQMGGTKIITYTLAKESGSSLKGAGWQNVHTVQPLTKNQKGWSSRKGRVNQQVNYELKFRWEKSATQ